MSTSPISFESVINESFVQDVQSADSDFDEIVEDKDIHEVEQELIKELMQDYVRQNPEEIIETSDIFAKSCFRYLSKGHTSNDVRFAFMNACRTESYSDIINFIKAGKIDEETFRYALMVSSYFVKSYMIRYIKRYKYL